MWKNLLTGLFLFTLILGLSLFYLAYRYFPKDLLETLFSLNKGYLLASLLTLFLFHTFDTLRVIILARALKVHYPLFYGYLVSFVNTFGATITPAHLGGEFLPLYTLSRKGGHFYQILTIITMKGLSGFFFYLLFFPLTLKSLFENPKQAKEFLAIVGVLLLLSLAVYFFYSLILKKDRGLKKNLKKRLKRTFFKYYLTCKIFFKTKKKTFFLAILLSLLMYFAYLLEGVFLLKAFNPEVDELKVFLDQLPLLYAIFISPTPGGSGVGEIGALPIFSPYLPEELLGVFVLLWRLITQYFSAFLGGLIFLGMLLQDLKKL